MKRAIYWIFLVGIVGVGGGYLWMTGEERARALEYQLRLQSARQAFASRAVALRILDPDAYRTELGPTLASYFSAIDDLATRYPDQFDLERPRRRLMEEIATGRVREQQKAAHEERLRLATDLFKRMRSGQYRPLYTAADKTFRFDIYEAGPVQAGGGGRVRLSFVHWGAFGPVTYGAVEGTYRAEQAESPQAAKGQQPPRTPKGPKREPAPAVVLRKLVADSQPPTLVFAPDEWLPELPPGMSVGYYELPLSPREAAAIELAFDFNVATAGGSVVTAHILFPDIPIPEAWKIPAGAVWQAEEREASQGELEAAGAKPH